MENLKNVLSNKLNLIMILVAGIFCFQVFNLFSNGSETQKVNYIKSEISKLKDDVNKIYKSENEMGQKIDTFNLRIKGIHEAVTINNTKIENLKKDEKTKLDNFKSYDANKWEQYFANRYAKKTVPRNDSAKHSSY